MTTFLLAMVILLVLVVPLIAVARLANHLPRAVDQAVTQGMQTQAGGAAEPLAVLPGIERPAAAQPTLALVSADNADVHSMAARRRWELHALGILRRLLQVDLVATLGYALLPGLACGFSDVDTSFTGLPWACCWPWSRWPATGWRASAPRPMTSRSRKTSGRGTGGGGRPTGCSPAWPWSSGLAWPSPWWC